MDVKWSEAGAGITRRGMIESLETDWEIMKVSDTPYLTTSHLPI